MKSSTRFQLEITHQKQKNVQKDTCTYTNCIVNRGYQVIESFVRFIVCSLDRGRGKRETGSTCRMQEFNVTRLTEM